MLEKGEKWLHWKGEGRREIGMALKTMEKDKEKGLCHRRGRDHQDWPLLGRSWGVKKGGIESHKADRV